MADKSLILTQQENLELSKENRALKETVSTLLVEIDRLRNTSLVPLQKSETSSELNIINDQVRILELSSRSRALSLEEIRALDLLIKNKKILEPQVPLDADYTKIPEGSSEKDLLALAGTTIDEQRAESKGSTDNSVA